MGQFYTKIEFCTGYASNFRKYQNSQKHQNSYELGYFLVILMQKYTI